MRNLTLFHVNGRTRRAAFKPGSNLKAFLQVCYRRDFPPYPFDVCGVRKKRFPIEVIIICLNHYITIRGCFDPLNNEVVVCDLPLQMALGRQAFHYTELERLVKSQMFPARAYPQNSEFVDIKASWCTGNTPLGRVIELSKYDANLKFGVSEQVYISENLFQMLSQSGKLVRKDGHYSYSDLLWGVTDYFLESSSREEGNLFAIGQTPFDILRGVRYVHISQIKAIVSANCSRIPSMCD